MNSFVSELNGYLQSLRRLTAGAFDYGAILVASKNEDTEVVREYLDKMPYKSKVLSHKKNSHEDVKAILTDYIFSNLGIEEKKIVDLLEWDVIEYFGMALDESVEARAANSFNPLVENGAIVVEVETSFYFRYCLIVIKVSDSENIIVSLGKRTET